METRNTPQDPIRKTIAAIVGVAALGFFVAWQDVTATDRSGTETDALPAAGYFPAQFQIRPAADESSEPIPTF